MSAYIPPHAESLYRHVVVKQEVNELEQRQQASRYAPHDTDMIKSINRFRSQLLSASIQLKEQPIGADEWTDIINALGGEEALISRCSMFEFYVRRSLVAIRVNNDGFMGQCSLLRIIDNGVATTQFCRLVKGYYAESCFVATDNWPSRVKLRENDSDGDNVIREMRAMTEDQVKPDFGSGTKEHLLGVSDVLDLRRSKAGDSGYLYLNRFIDNYMQALNRYILIGTQKARFIDVDFEKLMKQYNLGPIGTWSIIDGSEQFVTSGITETTSVIQLQCKIGGSNEEMIKRMCKRVTVFVLFVEACAIKSTFNRWKLSNATSADVIYSRQMMKFNANIEYIKSQQHTF